MARSVQISCDQCGKRKQETNRWFVVAQAVGHLYVAVSEAQFDERYKLGDLCGEECVLKFVAQKMREMK